MANNKVSNPGIYREETTITQFTAPGNSTAINTGFCTIHNFQIKVATIDTNVVVAAEGSLDGTNFFRLNLADELLLAAIGTVQITSFAIGANGIATITANGTYHFQTAECPLKQIRLVFVSESGGTAATINAVYFGQ